MSLFHRDDMKNKTPFEKCSLSTQAILVSVARRKPGSPKDIGKFVFAEVDADWIMVPTRRGNIMVILNSVPSDNGTLRFTAHPI